MSDLPQPETGEDPSRGGREPRGLAPGELYRLAWTFYLFLAIAGAIWLGVSEKLDLDIFLDPSTLIGDVLVGVGAAGVLLVAWHLGRRFVERMRRLEDAMRDLIGHLEREEVFALALISGFAEELFFRGAVQVSWGWIWSTVLFALLHSGPGPVFRIWTVFALVAGALFAAVTELRGTLLPAIVAHFLVNWINLGALIPKRPSGEPEGGEPDP